MNNPTTVKGEGARVDVDEVLHDYFQSQMPHPWPTLHLPKAGAGRVSRAGWARYSGRLALAACITVLIAGYLTLSAYFPRHQVGQGIESLPGHLGLNPKSKRVALPPMPELDENGPSLVPMNPR